MRNLTIHGFLSLGILLCLSTLSGWAQAPLSRPAPPKVEIIGQPGTRTVYYWAYAINAKGHTAYSDPVVVKNAPDVLSEKNAVALTPSPMDGATGYGILSSRCDAPKTAKVVVGATGKKTYYYWFQARNGRTVWSPVEGPLEVKGCAEPPENTITWADTGAEYYYLYRTETPVKPMGWRACVLLGGGKELTRSDKGLIPAARIVSPAGNLNEKPEGTGFYRVGTSNGAPILDQGQPLASLLIYDLNTTDPAFNQFIPDVKAYEPSRHYGTMTLNTEHREKSPTYSWDLFNSICVTQRNIAGGLNAYPANESWSIDRENGKNTYNGISIHQFNYTPAQHSPYLTFMFNYGLGDNVLFHASMQQHGQNRTNGDEGSEFFSLHMSRLLSVDHTKLLKDAAAGATLLPVNREIGTAAGARGIVNLTQKYTAGKAHVEAGSVAVGVNVNWTPEMEGRWISFDADTTKFDTRTIRQWYLVQRYISPTRLQLFTPTYWGRYNYKGRARQDGDYQICPYTEMTDGDALTDLGLKVAPLTCAWNAGDEVEAIAGPQTTCRLGWWNIGGDFLPQDHIAGLGISYNGNKPTDEGALITYKWGIALEVHDGNIGLDLNNTKVGMRARKETPVLISVLRDETSSFQLAQNDNGFVFEDSAGHPWMSVGAQGITLHDKAAFIGSQRTRGKAIFSGDGKATVYTIPFPVKLDSEPFVVASSNLPIGMGVTAVYAAHCIVTFATPPPAGTKNIVVTWMVQE
ncbi:MAG: hypothetical protein ACYDBB_16320 [Armatimonadota bacterium]